MTSLLWAVLGVYLCLDSVSCLLMGSGVKPLTDDQHTIVKVVDVMQVCVALLLVLVAIAAAR